MFPKLHPKIYVSLLLLIALVYCLIEAEGEGDFFIFVSASGRLDGHTNIYTYKFLGFYNYYYSVLFALLLKPFYFLPFFWVKFFWLVTNLFLYYKVFNLLAQSAVVQTLTLKQLNFFLTAVFLFSFRFLHDNIHNSQITILILWCCVYGVYWIHSGKTIRGSLLLALGINIKLLPIVLLPYLLYRGYFKAFTFTLSAYILSLFAPGLLIGNSYNLVLLQKWFNLINPTNQQHIMDVDERSFHGLTTLLTTLFIEHPPDPLAMPIKRNVADVSIETLARLIFMVRLVLVGFTLYFLRTWPFKKASRPEFELATLSYLLLLVPLIFPHQQHYAFLFATPAFAFVLYMFVKNFDSFTIYKRRFVSVLLIIIYLLCNLKLLLGEFNLYYQHFKILTYGALLIIPMLIWALGLIKREEVNGKSPV